MKRVFITRRIPDCGVKILRDKGYEVDVSPHDRPLTRDELVSFLKKKGYDAVLSMAGDKIDSGVLDSTPATKIFANYAIGYDNFDIAEAKKRGIFLTNTPHGGVDRVAEHAWALILALSCKVVEGDRYMREGRFTGFDPMLFQGMKIRGKVLGLIGAGHIGTEVARIGALGFDMRIAYHDIVRNPGIEELHNATYWPTVEDVLKQADIVSLHVPLLDSTKHLMNPTRLRLMKTTSLLVNTSRGAVVDEAALIEALRSGTIAGAGLDVFEYEPALSKGLTELQNVVITPHIASSTVEAREDMARMAAQNIVDMLECGKPKDVVY